MKVGLLLIMMVLLVGLAAAESIQVNVSEKSLVVAGDTPNFYGIVKSNTSEYYVTGFPTNLQKTLEILNKIDISSNSSGTWTTATIEQTGGIITA